MVGEFDWITAGLIAGNVLGVVIIFRIRAVIGPKYWSSVMKAIALRFKHPINGVRLYKSQYIQPEVIDANAAVQFDKETDNSPITINEAHRYNGESEYKWYFFGEGHTENFDPLKMNEKLYEILKRIGLLNDKYLDYKEKRIRNNYKNEILTTQHFNKIAIMGGIALLVIGYFMWNIVDFSNSVTALYNDWVPIIEQQIQNVPRLVPDGGGGGLDPNSILEGINGG